MTRSSGLAVLFLLAVCWMTALAQGGGDPDAKGTVTVKVTNIDKGAVTVEVARGAVAGWNVGPVAALACKKGGGFVHEFKLAFPAWNPDSGDPPPAVATGTLSLPNGDYTLWAFHDVESVVLPPNQMKVGSTLVSFTVTDGTANPPPPQGDVNHAAGSPTRQQQGTVLVGSGGFNVNAGWRLTSTKPLYMGAIPVGGGKYREGVANTVANNQWSNANADVNPNLTYNAVAILVVAPKPGTTGLAHNIGSAWVTDK
jgi:hypothetical protein